MKIVKRNLAPNKSGSVKIILDEQDDLWFVYNLIAKGDTIITDTSRKVIKQSKSYQDFGKQNKIHAKSNESTRVKFKIELEVAAVDYDKDSSTIRVRGTNLVANEAMGVGASHTLEIERNKEFELKKDHWDLNAIQILNEASEQVSGADLAVLILQPPGSAQLFLVGKKTTRCANIQASKGGGNKFFDEIFQAFKKHIDFNIVRYVVLGSPGTLRQQVKDYIFQEATRLNLKAIKENKSRFVMVNIGNKSKLKEVLLDNEVMEVIKGTKAVLEIKAYKEFSDLLMANSDRVCYGPKSVEIANEMNAIETLLITDDLVRCNDIALRQKNMELVKSVQKTGGKAFVFSPLHVSGEQLAKLTGIAAILRFPCPDLEELVL
ncbi:Translation release factor pelota-like protein [Corchorus olitorius]|uniref:Protein pelota homolog n=1 Tax=Corchorus olitorius TaxID=93759 RepID=A0A1R3INB7_9ROSI|nr:Translation release factor pelota-like protein [Corchorus olitorius]